jgi:nucleoside-diphosphate-sugar epimerase
MLVSLRGPQLFRGYGGVIAEFIKRVSRGKPPIIFGDGEQTGILCNLKNIIGAIIASLRNERARCVFNISSGRRP